MLCNLDKNTIPKYALFLVIGKHYKRTVRLIETVRLALDGASLRSYGTFKRNFWEIFQTVRLIETVRLAAWLTK